LISYSLLYIYQLMFKIHIIVKNIWIRDRPFNLKRGGYGFLFRSEFFFRTTQELEYLFISSHKVRNFFPEFNIRLYDKNFFFFLSTKIRIFFSATLGILEKNHNPPFKLNGHSLTKANPVNICFLNPWVWSFCSIIYLIY
jgi:hypothetical protein